MANTIAAASELLTNGARVDVAFIETDALLFEDSMLPQACLLGGMRLVLIGDAKAPRWETLVVPFSHDDLDRVIKLTAPAT